MPTRQEIAANATVASARAARRRRFGSAVLEMCEHPDDLSATAEGALAELLRRKGWRIGDAAAAKRS